MFVSLENKWKGGPWFCKERLKEERLEVDVNRTTITHQWPFYPLYSIIHHISILGIVWYVIVLQLLW